MRYRTHYTLEEARALLPQVRKWLEELDAHRVELIRYDEQLNEAREGDSDLGGALVHSWDRLLVEVRSLLLQFSRRDIEIKDLERGLIDFPAVIDGREVFLCWEKAEDDIEFWHDLDTGYAGRVKIEED